MTHPLHNGLRLGERRYSNSRPIKRVANFRGLPINIEIEVGDIKSGTDDLGRPWSHEYDYPYGEVKGTHALSDGDPVDVYLGPDHQSEWVYVIHQNKADGSYDEDKCMLGFSSEGEAVSTYKNHGPAWGFGSLDRMTFDQFKHGYLAANRRHR